MSAALDLRAVALADGPFVFVWGDTRSALVSVCHASKYVEIGKKPFRDYDEAVVFAERYAADHNLTLVYGEDIQAYMRLVAGEWERQR